MTTQEIITIAKEKLGKDITEQQAQDYLSGKTAIPDEAMDIVSGGGECNESHVCPNYGSTNMNAIKTYRGGMVFVEYISGYQCQDCGQKITLRKSL